MHHNSQGGIAINGCDCRPSLFRTINFLHIFLVVFALSAAEPDFITQGIQPVLGKIPARFTQPLLVVGRFLQT
jgi:hypothetical protein